MSRKCFSRFALVCALLLSLGVLNAHAQPAPTSIRYRLAVAQKNQALELVLPTVPRSDIRPDGAIPSAFVDPIESFTKDGEIALLWTLKPSKKSANPAWLTIVLEPAAQGLSPQEFRAFALKKFAKGAYDIKHVEHNGIPLARYTTGSLAAGLYAAHGVSTLGAKDTARNLEAFLVGGETWARIKLTADSLGAEEERAFYSAVESARFVDTSNPATSFDYYSLGRSFSAKKDFARAAGYLASAITLEQNHAQLNAKHWRDLIMKSAEAYVTTSRLPAAAQVLEYGVTRDPTNETFQMQLARTYASMGDMAKTLATLKTTFQLMKKKKEIFEKTSFPGTTSHTMSLPDLNRDPAFKEMMKDKAFREAVKAFKN